MKKQIIKMLVDNKAEKNNTIDLNTYEQGIIDAFKYIELKLKYKL